MSTTPSTNAELDPLISVSEGDHGGYIVFATFASLLVAFAFWTVRLAVRWRKRFWAGDDVMLVLAMAFAIPQSACVRMAVQAGLGKHDADVGIQLDLFLKYYYTAQLMNIASQACSKASINFLFGTFAAFRPFVVANWTLLLLAICWAIAAIFTTAFQCNLPDTWKIRGQCIDLNASNNGINISNVILEAMTILLPMVFMPQVHTSWSIRLIVILSFATRVLVIISLGGQIFSSLEQYQDLTWHYGHMAIWMQMTMNVSILTACVPGAQDFLARLRPGVTALIVDDGDALAGAQDGHRLQHLSIFESRQGRKHGAVVENWELTTGQTDTFSSIHRSDKHFETESRRELMTRDGYGF